MSQKGRHPWFTIERTLIVNLNDSDLTTPLVEQINEEMAEKGMDTLMFRNAKPGMFGQFLRNAQVGHAIELGKYQVIEKIEKPKVPVGV